MLKTSLLSLLALVSCVPAQRQPHIMYIWVDDMGWNDVSWSDHPEIPTPFLKQLRANGTELLQFYTQSKCTPSRAALLTGKYPFRYGAQTKEVYKRNTNASLDSSLKLLPAYLKDLGYATHMVGKWHLGFCSRKYIPTERGFDTFFGSYVNTHDYFHHDNLGYDWHWVDQPYLQANGTYNTHLITNHTQHMLRRHFTDKATKKQPVFFYVSYLAPHLPMQVPDRYISPECLNIQENKDDPKQTRNRIKNCGMIAALDEGIKNITNTLRELGKLDDFIIIFSNDNGGSKKAGASNFPLRGSKQTIYEGGTRVRTIIHAPKYRSQAKKKYNGLIHVTDVLPTFYEAAGGNLTDLPGDLDGVSFWRTLRNNRRSKRKWMVYNMDSSRSLIAVRFKNFKLVYHNTSKVSGHQYNSSLALPETVNNKYSSPTDFYRLFDLRTNPNEYEPSEKYPDAAEEYPDMVKKLKRKMQKLWPQEVFPKLVAEIPEHYPYRPAQNNGAYGVGDCDYTPPQ